jgi:CDP-4-dehydro-6-deoxyglucose reductase
MTATVTLKPSNHSFSVNDNETALAAALRQGVALPYSCRNGSCGTCKAKLVAGEIDYGVYEEKALSASEKAAGHCLLCQAKPKTDLVVEVKELPGAAGIPIKIFPARVIQMERAAHDVMVLKLKLPEGQRLQFLAGQYVDILLPGNKRRSFSLATNPLSDEALELHIRHVPGGAYTGQVFTTMKEKDLIRVQGPLGAFFLREESEGPVLLVAGGTGFAPIKGILENAFARGVNRPFHLYWGVRAKRDLYRDELIRSWAATHGNFRYTPVLSEPLTEDTWTGRTGFVHEAIAADFPTLADHEVYASGPPPMVEALKKVVMEKGLNPERLHYDSFEFAKP